MTLSFTCLTFSKRTVLIACIGLVIFLLLTSSDIFAEERQAYSCQPEVVSGVEHTETGNIAGSFFDNARFQLTLTNESGQWQLWENSDSEPVFANCQNEYRCDPVNKFYGIFYQSKQQVFTYIIQKAYGPELERKFVFTMKGRCTLTTP